MLIPSGKYPLPDPQMDTHHVLGHLGHAWPAKARQATHTSCTSTADVVRPHTGRVQQNWHVGQVPAQVWTRPQLRAVTAHNQTPVQGDQLPQPVLDECQGHSSSQHAWVQG